MGQMTAKDARRLAGSSVGMVLRGQNPAFMILTRLSEEAREILVDALKTVLRDLREAQRRSKTPTSLIPRARKVLALGQKFLAEIQQLDQELGRVREAIESVGSEDFVEEVKGGAIDGVVGLISGDATPLSALEGLVGATTLYRTAQVAFETANEAKKTVELIWNGTLEIGNLFDATGFREELLDQAQQMLEDLMLTQSRVAVDELRKAARADELFRERL